MDKINCVINIIKSSLSFDNALKNKQICDLNKINDMLKFHLQNLNLLLEIPETFSQSSYLISDSELKQVNELCRKLYE